MFRFKKFSVEDSNSSMKVGTDAVILGAWTKPGHCQRILEIGTGCGVISLMLAQKSKGIIDAIDIDKDSAIQASENFRNSPWQTRLNTFSISLHDFAKSTENTYDLIVCNPPYFTNSLKPVVNKKIRSRHTVTLTPKELYSYSKFLTEPDATVNCIIPVSEEAYHITESISNGFFCLQKLYVKSVENKQPYIVALQFGKKQEALLIERTLSIKGINNLYSDDYVNLTKEFYLYF